MEVDKKLVDDIQGIVREVGILILSYLGKKHSYKDKDDGSFATEADYASEAFLTKELRKIIPDAGFWAEESGIEGDVRKGYSWIIDPIDGTTNFAHNFPYFAVNVALSYDKEPLVGVTYNPVSDEMFWARKGEGAFLNSEPIHISGQSEAKKAMCSLAVPCNARDCHDFYDLTRTLQDNIHTVRKLGCAALDMASVACGRLDAAVLRYVSWWDIAPGILLIREAGGTVSEFNKLQISSDFETCLGSNGQIHEELMGFLT